MLTAQTQSLVWRLGRAWVRPYFIACLRTTLDIFSRMRLKAGAVTEQNSKQRIRAVLTRSRCDELLQGVAPDGALRRQVPAARKALRYVGYLSLNLLHCTFSYKNSTNARGAAYFPCWRLYNEILEVCTPVQTFMLSAFC